MVGSRGDGRVVAALSRAVSSCNVSDIWSACCYSPLFWVQTSTTPCCWASVITSACTASQHIDLCEYCAILFSWLYNVCGISYHGRMATAVQFPLWKGELDGYVMHHFIRKKQGDPADSLALSDQHTLHVMAHPAKTKNRHTFVPR